MNPLDSKMLLALLFFFWVQTTLYRIRKFCQWDEFVSPCE